jgi:hypothetical protein
VSSGFVFLQRAREAAATVALSHQGSCRCVVCEAARGDEDALLEVVAIMADETEIHVWKAE